VTAATEHDVPDQGRAETYLRLQAESELRRALALPEYKPPRDHRASSAVLFATQARRMRRRRAVVARLTRKQAPVAKAGRQGSQVAPGQRERRARSFLAAIQQAATSSTAVARSAARPFAPLLRRSASHVVYRRHQLWDATWHQRRRLRRRLPRRLRRRHEPPAAHACLERVTALASVLAGVGAISEKTELDVVSGFEAALATRSRIGPEAVLGFGDHWMHRHMRAHPAPSGPPRAHPVGVSAQGEVRGVPIRFYLGVLMLDQQGAAITMRARFPAKSIEHDHRHVHPMFYALSEVSGMDDRGGSYHADFSGGGGDGKWDGRLHLNPAPPAGVRWLDMTLPGAPVVRAPMDAPPADLPVTIEAVRTTAADRFLDAQTAHLMLASANGAAELLGDNDPPSLTGMAADLLAAGVISMSSESLHRLAGAAAHFGVQLPGSLAAIEPASLPADWLSLGARADREDGPTGIIAIAAVLPEVDGARCVIGELASEADSATMQVQAYGWPEPRHRGGMRIEKFEWTARDDLGGWYLLGNGGGSYSNGAADLDLQFTPTLDPKARSLDIILTGATTQVTVTVPLDWQEVA
jgi:hypothetical protein